MSVRPKPPTDLMRALGVRDPEWIVETSLARIWRVCRSDGTFAALKLYHHGRMGNETYGFDFLHAMNGAAAAYVYARQPNAGLIEWLPGPSLGDLGRDGRDTEVMLDLAEVARTLHLAPGPDTARWPRLAAWFAPFLRRGFQSNVRLHRGRALPAHKTLRASF